MLILAAGAVAMVLVVPRSHPLFEIASVMTPICTVVVGVMAWRLGWWQGASKTYRPAGGKKLVLYGGLAGSVVIIGVVLALVQSQNLVLVLGFLCAAQLIYSLFDRRPASSN